MKKLELTLVLLFALIFVVPGAWGSNKGKGNNGHIDAAEMSGLGLAIASLLVGGVYLIRRQSSSRR